MDKNKILMSQKLISLRPSLLRLAMKLTHGNKPESEDLVSLAIEKALTTKTFDLEKRIFPWMYQIVVNNYRDSLKKKDALKKASDIDLLRNNGTVQIFHETFDLSKAQQVISQTAWKAIVLSKGYDYTVEEISQIMAAPQGTVKSLISRGIRKIRKEIEVSS